MHIKFLATTNHVANYAASVWFNYLNNVGFLLAITVIWQIITGIILVSLMNIDLAFESLQYIHRDVAMGWLMQGTHGIGPSILFLLIGIHMARGIMVNSMVDRGNVWFTGVIVLFLFVATSYFGYILVAGQLWYWGGTVITNMLAPLGIQAIICGGLQISVVTLHHMLIIHFLLPLVAMVVVVIHLLVLHINGSSCNEWGIISQWVMFFRYLLIRDYCTLWLLILGYITMGYILMLCHPDNLIPMNGLVTPAHIVPEWYFLQLFAVLKLVLSYIGGLIWVIAVMGLVGTLTVRFTDYVTGMVVLWIIGAIGANFFSHVVSIMIFLTNGNNN